MDFTSFVLGILAAFSPCVIVLIPALIYRFNQDKKVNYKDLLLFSLSFIVVFILIALFFQSILSSSVKSGIQLGLGILFTTLGILALFNRFNPLNFPVIKNPLLFGLVFGLVTSVNPCTIGYLGVIVSGVLSSNTIFSMLLFSIAMLSPAVVGVIFGNKLLSSIKRTSRISHYLSHTMNVVLVAMGLYLAVNIKTFSFLDSIASSILVILTFAVIMRSFFLTKLKIDFKQILLIIALLGLVTAALIHCSHEVSQEEPEFKNYFVQEQHSGPTCAQDVMNCSVCRTCTFVFLGATLLGFMAIFLSTKLFTKVLMRKN